MLIKAFQVRSRRCISVDRIDAAPTVEESARIATERDNANGHTFQGWVVTTVAAVTDNGRRVIADPTDDNPYHAVIKIPKCDDEEISRHLKEIAITAYWKEKPLAVA